MKNTRPDKEDYHAFYETYIGKISTNDIVEALTQRFSTTMAFISSIPMEKWDFAYAEGKWTIKELLVHLLDAERIFTNRALRIARNDKTALPGFDQDDYAPFTGANERSAASIIEEYESVRKASLTLFKNLSTEMWQRKGVASDSTITPLAIAYIILGHETHHFSVLRERYL